ncbi:hemicentin-1-like [Syngnathoides biaculeatus]|uniref:hemicentin-1-like n=1 Tax=Syngnathoides biaculeatus TaxID=300417 RepID=UPI002ADE69A4|nr:hemicentin-1-like [Syngnathoides biaculeatus]
MLLEYLISALMMFSISEGLREVQEVLAASNSQVLLPCDCSSSHTVAWTKDHQGTVWRQEKSGLQFWGLRWLQQGEQRVRCPRCQVTGGDCGLRISNVGEQDGGLYTCEFQSGGRVVTRSHMLRVIKVSFSPMAPVAGVQLSITCSVTPHPPTATVRWRLNNDSFVPRSRVRPFTSPWTVEEKASVLLTGEWTCLVARGGKQGRASAALNVRGIVHPPRDDTKVYAAVGSAATLPCVFSAGLNPTETTWQKLEPDPLSRSSPDPLPPSFSSFPPIYRPTLDHSARLKDIGLEDEGTYMCSGVVEGQSFSRKVQLVVAKIDRYVTRTEAVTLTCQLTDTSEVTRYQWVHVTYDLSGARLVKPIQGGKSLRLSRVSPEDAAEWVCQFYGTKGPLGNVTHGIAPQYGHLSGLANLSYTTSVALGVSAFLVLLVLILAQMYRNHQRRKRIFQYATMESILHAKSNEREAAERGQRKN